MAWLLWFDVNSVEGRKEEKVKEIKGEGDSAIWDREKRRSPSKWDWGQYDLEELWERERERERER